MARDPLSLLAYAALLLVVGAGVLGIIVTAGSDSITLIPLWLAAAGFGVQQQGVLAKVKNLQATVAPPNGQGVIEKIDTLQRAVGPANGESTNDLLQRIVKFEQEQDQRNREVMEAVTPIKAALPMILQRLELGLDAAGAVIDLRPPATPARTPSKRGGS